MNAKMEVIYFSGIRSRGDIVRLVAAIREIPLDYKHPADWAAEKASAPEGTLPYGKDLRTGTVYPNSADLCSHLAQMEHNNMPVVVNDELQQILYTACNEGQISDINRMFNLTMKDNDKYVPYKVESGDEKFAAALGAFFQHWSDEYTKAGTVFLSKQDQPGVGEVMLFHIIDLSLVTFPEVVKKYPRILSFFKSFISIPSIKSFLQSRDRRGSVGRIGSLGRTQGLEPALDFAQI